MPTIRSYPQATSLLPTDALVIDRIGTGSMYVEGENLPALAGVLITSAGTTLQIGVIHSVRTSQGAFSATLPALSTVTPGEWLEWQDIDNDAAANNFTVNAAGSDLIANHGSTSSSTTMSTSNTITRATAGPSAWRVITYGS